MLNLRMVTEGTGLHEIVEDCLRITRRVGVTAQMEMLGRDEDEAQIILCLVFDNIFVFVTL